MKEVVRSQKQIKAKLKHLEEEVDSSLLPERIEGVMFRLNQEIVDQSKEYDEEEVHSTEFQKGVKDATDWLRNEDFILK